MFRKLTTKESAIRSVFLIATIPLDMWIFGWALAIVGGPDITRGESFVLTLAISLICSKIGESTRSAMEIMIK